MAASTSSEPLFSGEKIREGMHISSIGAHAPKARELDSITIKRKGKVRRARLNYLRDRVGKRAKVKERLR